MEYTISVPNNLELEKEVEMQALNLKLERLNKGLKQSDLAKMMDKVPQTISNWENGIIVPSYKELKKLSEILGKDIDYLLEEERR